MKILLSEAHVAVTGKFKSFASLDVVVSKLLIAGAESAGRRRTPETNLVVSGRLNHKFIENKLEKAALVRGIPVVDELQLKELLREGELEVDDAGIHMPGEGRLSELVAQARGVLDGALSSRRWSALVALVDGCAPEEVGGLVDYLAPQLERWPNTDRHARWRPSPEDLACLGHLGVFFDGLVRGELRVAPPSWLYAAVDGDDVRLRMASYLRFAGLGMKTRSISAILKSPSLGSMRLLDLRGAPVETLDWARISKHASWPKLTTLCLSSLNANAREALQHADLFLGVTRLYVQTRRYNDIEDIAATLALPIFDHVEEVVTCSAQDLAGLTSALEAPGVLPSLTTWEAELRTSREVWTEASEPVRRRVERIRLVAPRIGPSIATLLQNTSFDGLVEFDLSGLVPRRDEGAAPGAVVHARSVIRSHLKACDRIRRVPRLVLGELVTRDLRELLEAEGVELV